jgi:hypothetical protein
MALAETKAKLAERLADNDLTLEQPQPVAKAKPKGPAKTTEKPAPIAAPPPSATTTGAASKSATNPGATKTKKATTPAPIFR